MSSVGFSVFCLFESVFSVEFFGLGELQSACVLSALSAATATENMTHVAEKQVCDGIAKGSRSGKSLFLSNMALSGNYHWSSPV